MFWLALGFLLLVIGLCCWWLLRVQAAREEQRAVQRARFRIDDTGERVPLAAVAERAPPRVGSLHDVLLDIERERIAGALETQLAGPIGPTSAPGVIGRLVMTIDGEGIITTPPFELRRAVLSNRMGRYINKLQRRVPPWIVACPRVRLDALVTPTAPDGRDAADWREWRKRVRFRAVDIVLCDRRTWRPVVVLLIDRPSTAADIKSPGGGKDRIFDEVLQAIGLPLLRVTGVLARDWPLIAPYVDEAILRTRDQCVEGDSSIEWTASGVLPVPASGIVSLLNFDDDRGGLLQ